MDAEKMIKKLAEQENVPAWFVRYHMQEWIDTADWSPYSPNGVKPETMEKAIKLLTKNSIKLMVSKLAEQK